MSYRYDIFSNNNKGTISLPCTLLPYPLNYSRVLKGIVAIILSSKTNNVSGNRYHGDSVIVCLWKIEIHLRIRESNEWMDIIYANLNRSQRGQCDARRTWPEARSATPGGQA